MALVDRLAKKLEADARGRGIVDRAETVVCFRQARLSGFTSELGRRESPYRPPWVTVGLTEARLFVMGRDEFSARAWLALVTHAQLAVSGELSVQWVTPRDTAACLALKDVSDPGPLWSALKAARDGIWATFGAERQVELTWLSGSQPGVIWRNTGTLEEMRAVHSVFVAGGLPAMSDRHCSLVKPTRP